MLPRTLEALRQACGGAWASTPQPDRRVVELVTDTRSISRPGTALFVALTGPHRDGHRFLQDAYAKGIRAFLVAATPTPALLPDAAVLQVPDTGLALQDIAVACRTGFAGPVVGVTGSNGKTVVKEWLHQALSDDGPVLRSPKSYNSQVGVPLSVWLLELQHRVAVFEAGISRPGEMARLQRIIRPSIGVFTNLGDAHREGFASDAEKAAEKMQLFAEAETLVYSTDNPVVRTAVQDLQAVRQQQGRLPLTEITWSQTGTEAVWQVRQEDHGAVGQRLTLEGPAGRFDLALPFSDAAALENAVHCWLVLHVLGVSPEAARQRLARLQPVSMRLELRKGLNDCTLLDDAYNSDLTSLRIALDVLGRQRQHARHTVILSDLQQAGMPDAELYAAVAALVRERGVQRFIGIGPALSAHRALFKGVRGLRSRFFTSTAAFLKALPGLPFENEAILLKGARVFAFERIAAALEAELHRTVLSIDLPAMLGNLAVYRTLVAPGTRVMAMVKAFSYGSGSYEVAAALQHAGVDYLAVAYPDEGVALRERGITLPIMVMSPDVASFDRMMAWKLEPEIFNFRSLAACTAAAEGLGLTGYPVHIKLDTGMHRLGFGAADLPRLAGELQRNSRLRVASIFSHLAASEDPAFDAVTRQQAAVFEQSSAVLLQVLPEAPLRHLCNSSGIARHPGLHYDMVRLGLGLYGLEGSPVLEGKLHQVSRLRTTIAQIRTVPAGEGIGYGFRSAAPHDRRIATVCIGYADGYPRALGQGRAHMLVRGRPAPTVGSICMDLCMLDVSAIPGAAEGDEAVVFGPELSLQQLAAWSDTIPYEIMTGISQRVKRVYVNEA